MSIVTFGLSPRAVGPARPHWTGPWGFAWRHADELSQCVSMKTDSASWWKLLKFGVFRLPADLRRPWQGDYFIGALYKTPTEAGACLRIYVMPDGRILGTNEIAEGPARRYKEVKLYRTVAEARRAFRSKAVQKEICSTESVA